MRPNDEYVLGESHISTPFTAICTPFDKPSLVKFFLENSDVDFEKTDSHGEYIIDREIYQKVLSIH